MPRVLALVATIPVRKTSCERLLSELTLQTRPPDGVVLVLDGYGETLAPKCSLPVALERRTPAPSGAGQRWKIARDLPPEDILICLDDDIMLIQAPRLVLALSTAIESGGAAAAMGFGVDHRQAPPGPRSRGQLIYGAGCGFAARAGDLVGVEDFAAEVQRGGGPDMLGVLGDDDALVSAFLWKKGVKIIHAATGNIFAAPNTRKTSQTGAKMAQKVDPDAQKLALQRITGWPWRKADGRAR